MSVTVERRVKRWIVVHLETVCEWTHWVTHHRPWLWVFQHCPFAVMSCALNDRWGLDVWKVTDEP